MKRLALTVVSMLSTSTGLIEKCLFTAGIRQNHLVIIVVKPVHKHSHSNLFLHMTKKHDYKRLGRPWTKHVNFTKLELVSPLLFFFWHVICFYLFIYLEVLFWKEEMVVKKHSHDSVEVLPVPIKWERDHHDERWPWHNWDPSQREPDGWSDGRGGTEKKGTNKQRKPYTGTEKHNINTTSFILWISMSLTKCIKAQAVGPLLAFSHISNECTPCQPGDTNQSRVHVLSGWNNKPDACWEAHVLNTEEHNAVSPSHHCVYHHGIAQC